MFFIVFAITHNVIIENAKRQAFSTSGSFCLIASHIFTILRTAEKLKLWSEITEKCVNCSDKK